MIVKEDFTLPEAASFCASFQTTSGMPRKFSTRSAKPVGAFSTIGAGVGVVIGIGGSYLGARAVIDALSNSFAALFFM